MNRKVNICMSALIILLEASCTSKLIVKSPDNNNSISLELNEDGTLFYSVQSHGTIAIEKSVMGMDITDSTLDFNSGLSSINQRKG